MLRTTPNCVFIKNLAQNVTEPDVREKFELTGDKIMNIQFKNFPDTPQQYCQVDFETSAGVTAAKAMHDHPLRGVKMMISVVDPVGPLNDITNTRLMRSVSDVFVHGRYVTEEQAETLARTLCIKNVPPTWEFEDVKSFLKNVDKLFGLQKTRFFVTPQKVRVCIAEVDSRSQKESVVEFKEEMRTVQVDGETYILDAEPSKVAVDDKPPENISFQLPPGTLPSKVLHRYGIEDKMARVRDMQKIVASRLFGAATHAKTDSSRDRSPSNRSRGRSYDERALRKVSHPESRSYSYRSPKRHRSPHGMSSSRKPSRYSRSRERRRDDRRGDRRDDRRDDRRGDRRDDRRDDRKGDRRDDRRGDRRDDRRPSRKHSRDDPGASRRSKERKTNERSVSPHDSSKEDEKPKSPRETGDKSPKRSPSVASQSSSSSDGGAPELYVSAHMDE